MTSGLCISHCTSVLVSMLSKKDRFFDKSILDNLFLKCIHRFALKGLY